MSANTELIPSHAEWDCLVVSRTMEYRSSTTGFPVTAQKSLRQKDSRRFDALGSPI